MLQNIQTTEQLIHPMASATSKSMGIPLLFSRIFFSCCCVFYSTTLIGSMRWYGATETMIGQFYKDYNPKFVQSLKFVKINKIDINLCIKLRQEIIESGYDL